MAKLHTITTDQQLHFDGNAFPQIIGNQTNISNIEESVVWVKQHLPTIEQHLSQSGAVLFRGFPIHDAQTFDDFSAAFGYPSFTYAESLSNAVRINFTERVFTANEAPKEVEIYLHHEMAQTPISPQKLFFFCQTAANSGGATPVCRSDQLFEAVQRAKPELTEKLETAGIKYTTRMPSKNDAKSGQGRSWMSTLSVSNKHEAEQKLKELGYTWQWLEDDSLNAITPVLPAVITLENGKKVLYNQLVAAYMGWQGVRENPSKSLCFGDDSTIHKEDLELIASLCDDFTFDLEWQDGDMVIIDNKMVMHGRRPYSGERKRVVLVALAA